MTTIRCEKCGGPINVADGADREGYMLTGRCRACRRGLSPGVVGMIENLLGRNSGDGRMTP